MSTTQQATINPIITELEQATANLINTAFLAFSQVGMAKLLTALDGMIMHHSHPLVVTGNQKPNPAPFLPPTPVVPVVPVQ